MWESLASGQAPVPQAPHASTGGLVLPAGTNSFCSAGLVGVSLQGASRRLRAEIVWVTVSDGDIATNKGFGFGTRARGLSNATALLGGGLSKASNNNYRPTLFSSSIAGSTSASQGTALTVTLAGGEVVACAHVCEANGDIAGAAGTAFTGGMCSIPSQTAGGAIATAARATSHTERTDLQPMLFNDGVDGTNVIRAIRVMIDGLLALA
jgi:hypothetical protein